MRNHTPWWKWLIIAVIIVPGAFYALPNIFGDDPGIQLRGARGGSLGADQFQEVQAVLDEAGLPYDSVSLDDSGIRIRFSTTDAQLQARDMLEARLPTGFTIALTLLPAAPQWLSNAGALPMFDTARGQDPISWYCPRRRWRHQDYASLRRCSRGSAENDP